MRELDDALGELGPVCTRVRAGVLVGTMSQSASASELELVRLTRCVWRGGGHDKQHA